MEITMLWIVAITFSVATMGLVTTTRKAHRVATAVGRLHDDEGPVAEIVMMLKAERGLLALGTTISGGVSLVLIITAIRSGLQ